MTAVLSAPPVWRTAADMVRGLGGVPLNRIRARPAPGAATEADLVAALGSGGPACELVCGVLVEKPMGTREGLMAGLIFGALWDYLKAADLGRLFPGDSAFRMVAGNVRLPDVSFVPWDRLPADDTADKVWAATPALAVEVLSESNTEDEIKLKLRELFAAGCNLAWVIDPRSRTAKVHTSARRSKLLGSDGILDGGKVLPGFKLPLADLFAATERRKKK